MARMVGVLMQACNSIGLTQIEGEVLTSPPPCWVGAQLAASGREGRSVRLALSLACSLAWHSSRCGVGRLHALACVRPRARAF